MISKKLTCFESSNHSFGSFKYAINYFFDCSFNGAFTQFEGFHANG